MREGDASDRRPSGTEPWALFLDFDGTLVDLAPTPETVIVPPELRGLLEGARGRLGGAVAIVTGRPLADIDAFLPGLAIDGCGLHGLERRTGGRTSRPAPSPRLAAEADALRRRFEPHPGILIEDKGVGVAVHWRLAPQLAEEAAGAVAEAAARLGDAFRVQDGKAVREIVPRDAGKGAGIRAMMEAPPYRGRRPLFAGDDRTDEDGFEAVLALGGAAVKIGTGSTIATARMESPTAFRAWIVRFLASPRAVESLMVAG